MSFSRLLTALFVTACFGTQPACGQVESDRTQDVKRVAPIVAAKAKEYGLSSAVGDRWAWVLEGEAGEGNSIFAWTIRGKKYISAIAMYTPNLTPLPDCKPDDSAIPNAYCDGILERHSVCHLILFDAETLKQAAAIPLDVARDRKQLKGKPRCESVKAMASASVAPDILLVTLGYSDSAEMLSKPFEPSEFITTIALHFDPTPGVLRVEQRDDCLGNPNNYKTIAAARKRLRECAATTPRSQQAGAR